MRDFLPEQIRKREYVVGVIKSVYEKYAFEPLETPAVENLSTLTNKYGDEGDQLMYKILKRGEKLSKKLEGGEVRNENELSDLALRYDLTVPLARVIANYRNDLPRFFKRYQIQPVWRADRPARGRYREFYQCDVDAIGSSSMLVEAELCSAVSEILDELGFDDYSIRFNHRALLFAVLEAAGISEDSRVQAVVVLDKLDKIGPAKVQNEFVQMGVEQTASERLLGLFTEIDGQDNSSVLAGLKKFTAGIDEAASALVDLEELLTLSKSARLEFDPSLARGLSYYTGAIFEAVLTNGDFSGSIAGGGRYDGLIGMFGKEQIPAVGLSLGLERILMIMEERGLFPADLPSNPADVMITIWNDESLAESLNLAVELRAKGLRVLVYPQPDKLGKQFKYADQVGTPFVCVLGKSEIEAGNVALKNLESGDQEIVPRSDLASRIKS
jgi:histidyl-tRNA synthetase